MEWLKDYDLEVMMKMGRRHRGGSTYEEVIVPRTGHGRGSGIVVVLW